MKNKNFNTKAIHVGNHPDKETGAVISPLHFSSTFKQDGVGVHRGLIMQEQETLQEKDLKKTFLLWRMLVMGLRFPAAWLPLQHISNDE